MFESKFCTERFVYRTKVEFELYLIGITCISQMIGHNYVTHYCTVSIWITHKGCLINVCQQSQLCLTERKEKDKSLREITDSLVQCLKVKNPSKVSH